MAVTYTTVLYYPDSAAPTETVGFTAAGRNVIRPAEPVYDANVQFEMTAGGQFYTRKLAEERDIVQLQLRGYGFTMIQALESLYDAAHGAYKTIEYKDIDTVSRIVRWVGAFEYTRRRDGRCDMAINLELEL